MPNIHNSEKFARTVALNEALLDWGYTEDFVKYQRSLDKNMQKAQRADVQTRTSWMAEMRDWVAEGDKFVDTLYELASGEVTSSMLSVIFNVMYMRAAVEARLDNM